LWGLPSPGEVDVDNFKTSAPTPGEMLVTGGQLHSTWLACPAEYLSGSEAWDTAVGLCGRPAKWCLGLDAAPGLGISPSSFSFPYFSSFLIFYRIFLFIRSSFPLFPFLPFPFLGDNGVDNGSEWNWLSCRPL
jgi:hypothetical protein